MLTPNSTPSPNSTPNPHPRQAATTKLREAGATLVHMDAPVLDRAQAKLFANGGFAAAEAWHAHRELLATSQAEYGPLTRTRTRTRTRTLTFQAEYDPRVASRIAAGEPSRTL